MSYAIVLTCKEVRGERGGGVIVADNESRVVTEEEWVEASSTCINYPDGLPRNIKLFSSEKEAVAFAQRMDSYQNDPMKDGWWKSWHPWYCQPKSWKVIKLKPITTRVVTGWSAAD